jgi:hypothetical protein
MTWSKAMDIDDVIFTDDVAESLGSRGLDEEYDTVSVEEPAKARWAGFAAIGGVGSGILSFLPFLDR